MAVCRESSKPLRKYAWVSYSVGGGVQFKRDAKRLDNNSRRGIYIPSSIGISAECENATINDLSSTS